MKIGVDYATGHLSVDTQLNVNVDITPGSNTDSNVLSYNDMDILFDWLNIKLTGYWRIRMANWAINMNDWLLQTALKPAIYSTIQDAFKRHLGKASVLDRPYIVKFNMTKILNNTNITGYNGKVQVNLKTLDIKTHEKLALVTSTAFFSDPNDTHKHNYTQTSKLPPFTNATKDSTQVIMGDQIFNSLLTAIYDQDLMHYNLAGNASFLGAFLIDTNLLQFLIPDLYQMYKKDKLCYINFTCYDRPYIALTNHPEPVGPNI